MKILALKTEIPTVPGWLLAGPPGGRVITQGGLNTTRNAKKNQQPFKPGKWFNWSIHIWSRQVLDLTLVPTLPRKENWMKDFAWSEGQHMYLLIFLKLRVAVAVAGYDRSSMISVWMWDLFGCWKFCREAHCPAVTNCHTGRGALGLDGNNNQQLVRKTESGGLPLLLLLLLLSGKIHFTLLSLHSYSKSKEEGWEPMLGHGGALNGQVKTE